MKVQTVSEITKKIKSLIESALFLPVSISGEISSFSVSPSGHTYFVLKDENSKIKSVMFKRYRQMTAGYTPKNGDKVVITGDIRLYEPDGAYQVIVKSINYDSVGDFYKRFEAVKRKLEAEGLFESDNKQKLPKQIRRIALITSPTGAAINDFLVTLENNSVGFDVDLWPVQVQGESAVLGIVKALSHAGLMTDRYDGLVVMRGGGSIEDLSLFNDEFIARALYASKVPTISAIGHERDISICDFVADVRVATPTAAAEILAEGILSTVSSIEQLTAVYERFMELSVLKAEQKLDVSISMIEKYSPGQQIQVFWQNLHNQISRMVNSVERYTKVISHQYDKSMIQITQVDILRKCHSLQQDVDLYLQRIQSVMEMKLNIRKNDLQLNLSKIELLNPDLFLDKGYAIVKGKGVLIDSVDQANLDDELEIMLKDGYINGFVTGKRKKT